MNASEIIKRQMPIAWMVAVLGGLAGYSLPSGELWALAAISVGAALAIRALVQAALRIEREIGELRRAQEGYRLGAMAPSPSRAPARDASRLTP